MYQVQSFIVQVETGFHLTIHLSDGHSPGTCWVGLFGCEQPLTQLSQDSRKLCEEKQILYDFTENPAW